MISDGIGVNGLRLQNGLVEVALRTLSWRLLKEGNDGVLSALLLCKPPLEIDGVNGMIQDNSNHKCWNYNNGETQPQMLDKICLL